MDVDALLEWYEEVRRPLPWRETRDPYALLVSEVYDNKEDGSKMRKFQIEMMIDPEAEVQAASGVAGTDVELK